ncbi:MAG: hypothetical protein BWY32_01358 [bacterium ADurb.Bin243]|nr:MAG: hypothetical protein BWY32_01358 [bacterium ADurb.Bin243]
MLINIIKLKSIFYGILLFSGNVCNFKFNKKSR